MRPARRFIPLSHTADRPETAENRRKFQAIGVSSKAVIDVRRVSKSFERGTRVLDDVTFSVAEREMVALIGASGSGKSTLIRALAGLVPIDRAAAAGGAAGRLPCSVSRSSATAASSAAPRNCAFAWA